MKIFFKIQINIDRLLILSYPSYPILPILSYPSYHSYPTLFFLSYPILPILPILPICPSYPSYSILSFLSCLSSPSYPILPIPSPPILLMWRHDCISKASLPKHMRCKIIQNTQCLIQQQQHTHTYIYIYEQRKYISYIYICVNDTNTSQKFGCPASKSFLHLRGVFCTLLGPPTWQPTSSPSMSNWRPTKQQLTNDNQPATIHQPTSNGLANQ